MVSQTIRRNLAMCGAVFGLAVVLSASAAHRPPQAPASAASANEIILTVNPAQSAVHYTVSSSLHTVHGTFALKRGILHLDPVTGKATGEIVVDAISGESGNDSRDKRMHKEVLESNRFTDIVFRPDRVEGALQPQGSSSPQLHGVFQCSMGRLSFAHSDVWRCRSAHVDGGQGFGVLGLLRAVPPRRQGAHDGRRCRPVAVAL